MRWFLERRQRSGGGGGTLALPEPFAVVEDRADEQRIELALSNEDLTGALRAR